MTERTRRSKPGKWLTSAVLVAVLGAGCAGQTPTPSPEETAQETSRRAATISATGEVVPAQKATLSFTTSGTLVNLNVEVGDRVEQGDMIGSLDTSVVKAQIAKAETAVKVAEANLEKIKADPRTPSIEELKSNIAAASASVAEAVANRDKVRAGSSEYEIARAKADTQAAFIAAMSARYYQDYVQDVLNDQSDYNYKDPEYYFSESTFESAQEAYQAAYDNLIAAEAYLDELLNGPNKDELKAAEAEVWASSAEYLFQKARLDLLLAGAQIEDVDIAEIAVDQARAALETAKVNRDKAILTAPFDGVIVEVYVQEYQYATTGAPIVLLADLDNLRIETTDLNEIDVASIEVGDTVMVTFDALPNVTVEGIVLRIAPKSEEGAGVNFTVLITVEDLPEEIRWGMTAFVDVVQ